MTHEEALVEARRRWGRKAVAIQLKECLPRWAMPYAVGIRKGWMNNEVFGYGTSWEEAFDAADRAGPRTETVAQKSSRQAAGGE